MFNRDLPGPRLPPPIAPVLSRASFGARARRGAPALPAVTDAAGRGNAAALRLVSSGRVALGLALRELGVKAGDTVLLPAWHSLSMLGPVKDCCATARFYRVGMDTAPDLDDLEARLDPTVKAVVAVHYFGFPQDLALLRAWCDRHGLALVEDCAHCFFGERNGRAVGTLGDYAIASSMKFFPLYEGGCLVSARHRLDDVRLRSAGPGFEAKAALATLEISFRHGRLPLLHALLRLPLALKDGAWGALKRRAGKRRTSQDLPARALTPSSSDSGFDFDPWWLDKRSSLFSRAMLRLASRTRVVDGRRRNYLRLQQALGALPGCHPLYASLPDGACPWQFPLWCEDADAVFARLVGAGVPVVRFGQQLAPEVDDPTALALARQVLGIPCHQELNESELAWIAGQVHTAVTA